MRIEEMEIAAVDTIAWRIRVGPLNSPQTKELQYNARLLSPIPQGEDGSGLFAVPKVGDSCTVMLYTEGKRTDAYILGYRSYPNQNTGGAGGVEYKEGMEQGDIVLVNRIGMLFKSSIRGGFHWVVDSWAKLMIGMTNQELRGWFRNLYMRTRGGRVEWETEKENETSQYLSVVGDKFELDTNSDARVAEPYLPAPLQAGFAAPVYANKEITKIGTWSASAPFKQVEIRAGAKNSGELPNRRHISKYVVPDGPEVHHLYSGVLGVVEMKVLDGEEKLRLDILGGGGTPHFSLIITGDTMHMVNTGDITVSTDGIVNIEAAGSIRLGGDGEEQQLVTKKFVEDIFMTHTHIGNNGAPTSVPLNIAEIVNPASRDAANHFTKDTVAE